MNPPIWWLLAGLVAFLVPCLVGLGKGMQLAQKNINEHILPGLRAAYSGLHTDEQFEENLNQSDALISRQNRWTFGGLLVGIFLAAAVFGLYCTSTM